MRLGTIGQLDPLDGGNFDITMPDFTRDPVFEKFARDFGVIQLSLKEKQIDHTVVTIKAADAPELGLKIQSEYREPVVFTRIRQ